MMRIISFISLAVLLSCGTKSFTNAQNQPVAVVSAQPSYFVGTWHLAENYYIKDGKKVNARSGACAGVQYWTFTENSDRLQLSQQRASGTNCEQKHQTTATATIDGSKMMILRDDFGIGYDVEIVDNQQFKLSKKEYIAGSYTTLEYLFSRK